MSRFFVTLFKTLFAGRRHIDAAFRLALVMAIGLFLQGCTATPARLSAVPHGLVDKVEVPGMPGVRYLVVADSPKVVQAAYESLKREQDYLARQGYSGKLGPAVFLAISGGGDNGAFAAGLLNAWTETGTRPEFKLVTGISTGALIAPFAFVGKKYDATLKEVYTTTSPDDVMVKRSLLGGVLSDAMADNRPLLALTRKLVTQEFLEEIAAEHAKGRMLLIGTTDLDTGRGVIWDMGKIATYGGPAALDLFVKVMVASTSIPGAFPPMMIDVEAGGRRYQEMHVDGGVVAQVFAYPVTLRLAEEATLRGANRERELYIIRNARLDADWIQVQRATMSIAARAVASMIQSQGIGDLYRIYTTAHRDGVQFNLAFIPSSFRAPHREEFDTEYMRSLYDTAYDMALKGFPWTHVPPGFALPTVDSTGK
ncbi:patatin-like phospholipase family protein [Achromobacter mucicolens]|uniref:patatin-like phospholipase family protein n=1 Tax=Achromobacter mucicolens TaxID=1389922 RepID=UPI0022F3D709|nr:patatin-like phospholipase family protein [Achromobacter mucicolens]WBX86829.1 patatin-like phospholipase family protein [Achromobacter mucicolens]